jgi:Arc/MetJ family transcription regulator
MRTNIVLNDELLQEAALYTKAKTKTAVIEEALLVFVRVKAEEKARRGYEQKLRALDTQLSKLRPMRQSARDVLCADRARDE